MFSQVCVTLALGASALALSINTPSGVTSAGLADITWTSTSSDSIFTIELNHPSFNNALAIANSVNPANNNITVQMPPVNATDGYTLEFVNVTNINDVFATSGTFSIAPAVSISSTPSSTASRPSGTGSATGSGVGSSTTPTSPAVSGSGSGSISGSGSASNTGSGAPNTSSSAPASGAAAPLRIPSALAVVLLGVFAGTALVL